MRRTLNETGLINANLPKDLARAIKESNCEILKFDVTKQIFRNPRSKKDENYYFVSISLDFGNNVRILTLLEPSDPQKNITAYIRISKNLPDTEGDWYNYRDISQIADDATEMCNTIFDACRVLKKLQSYTIEDLMIDKGFMN